MNMFNFRWAITKNSAMFAVFLHALLPLFVIAMLQISVRRRILTKDDPRNFKRKNLFPCYFPGVITDEAYTVGHTIFTLPG
jgi:hypothetical protein